MKRGRWFRKIGLAAMLAAMSAAFLTGCGEPKTPEEVMKRSTAISLVNSADSYRTEMAGEVEYQTSVVGSLNVKVNVTSEVTAKPNNVHIKSISDMGAYGKEELEAYCMEDGDRYVLYMFDGKNWSKEFVNADQREEKLDGLNAFFAEGFAGYGIGLVKMNMSNDSVDGSDAFKIGSEISGSYVSDLMNQTAEEMGMNSGKISLDLDALPNAKMTFWIQKKSYLPLKVSLDMTDMMKGLMDQAVKGSYAQDKVKLTKAVFDCRFYDYDAVPEIKLSEEAASARMK